MFLNLFMPCHTLIILKLFSTPPPIHCERVQVVSSQFMNFPLNYQIAPLLWGQRDPGWETLANTACKLSYVCTPSTGTFGENMPNKHAAGHQSTPLHLFLVVSMENKTQCTQILHQVKDHANKCVCVCVVLLLVVLYIW